jgi:predicted alpha/beta-fold hydrolase
MPPTQLAPITEFAIHAEEFRPRRFLRNGHLQTIVGNYLKRPNDLPAAESQLVEVSPATADQISSQILCDCHWQGVEVRAGRPTAIIVHGLEGSSNSQYVVGNASKLWRAGCNIIRMNMRNCGGTEALSPTLYHSDLSHDVLAVMNFFVAKHGLRSMSLIGYSMGGNLVLKLAGELGAEAPPELRSVIGVSPAVDLGQSADALHQPQNRIYELKFLHALLRRFRRKAALFPQAYDVGRAVGIHSLREFDDRITAVYSGFSSADDYYYRAAAARVLDRIAVPTFILHALDDPFVRITEESCSAMRANPNITLVETEHGGHCAFLAPADADSGYDGYWAEHTLLRFLLAHA